jgi:hypothetical protein
VEVSYGEGITTFRDIEHLRASRYTPGVVVKLKTERPRGMVDPEIPEEWKDRPVIKASESPALAKRREEADKFERRRAKREGRLEEWEAARTREAAGKAEAERIEATAREQLEEEFEEAKIERAKARLRRNAEAVPG